MKYITGIHALNLPCSLETSGDWHVDALKWKKVMYLESDNSIWGDYGIERNKYVSVLNRYENVANHIRASLDLIAQGNFPVIQGMKNDFICTDIYDAEIFELVSKLAPTRTEASLESIKRWITVNKFMAKEYGRKWISYAKEKQIWEI